VIHSKLHLVMKMHCTDMHSRMRAAEVQMQPQLLQIVKPQCSQQRGNSHMGMFAPVSPIDLRASSRSVGRSIADAGPLAFMPRRMDTRDVCAVL
jgi:hypothetical protein